MKKMRITDVEAIPLSLSEIDAEESNGTQDALIVLVHTDAGITGIGEVDSSPYVGKAVIEAPFSHGLCHGLRELLIGEDPLEIERLWDKMYHRSYYYGRRGIVISAISGIDIALWDIKGKVYEQPVYKLLGGAYKEGWIKESQHPGEFPVYDSTLFPKDPNDLEHMRKEALKAVEHGFYGLKFGWESFGEDPDKDYALVKAAREVVGEQFKIMIDVGLKWDSKTAIERAELMKDLHPFWFEEPVPAGNFESYGRIARAVNSAWVVGGEHLYTRYDFQQLMDVGCVDAIQPDVSRAGGFTECRKIVMLAQIRNIPVVCHNWSTDILTRATLHFLAATPNAKMLEFCTQESPLRWEVTKNPITVKDMKNGRIRVPEEPGLGVELNEETIEKHHRIFQERIQEEERKIKEIRSQRK